MRFSFHSISFIHYNLDVENSIMYKYHSKSFELAKTCTKYVNKKKEDIIM